jgi:hypothetical protein
MAVPHLSGKAVAFMWGDGRLAMDARQAYAFSNIEAGFASPGDYEVMQSWLVTMVLLHGTWVARDIGPFQTGDVFPA